MLKAARSGWRAQQQAQAQAQQRQEGREPAGSSAGPPAAPATPAHAMAGAEAAAAVPGEAAAGAAPAAAAGPLLLFPDTSALLPMLGAGDRVSIPTFFQVCSRCQCWVAAAATLPARGRSRAPACCTAPAAAWEGAQPPLARSPGCPPALQLDWLLELTQAGRFGRALPPHEQVGMAGSEWRGSART